MYAWRAKQTRLACHSGHACHRFAIPALVRYVLSLQSVLCVCHLVRSSSDRLRFITDNSYPDREQVSETDNSSI